LTISASDQSGVAMNMRSKMGVVLLMGIGIRLLFLVLSGDLPLWADEASYAYLAMAWGRFGVYMGSELFLWPPLQPAILAFLMSLFDANGMFAAKLFQVLLSAVVGAMVMLLGARIFSPKAGLLAGVIWSVYLPLVGYTHYLWPETLFLSVFLPAVYLYLRILDHPPMAGKALWLPIGLGVLLGACTLIKESGLLLTGLICISIPLAMKSVPLTRRLWVSACVLLTVTAVILPWAQRNQEVYGHRVLSGATLGRNVYWGVNASYKNFDLPNVVLEDIYRPDDWVYEYLIQAPEGSGWRASTAANTIERSSENVDRSIEFVRANPAFFLRSRLKKAADWVTPLSFFTRQYHLGHYSGFLAWDGIRHTLVITSILLTMLVLAASIPGYVLSVSDRNARTVVGVTLFVFIATVPIVAMSRYRLPVEPLLIVLAAGFLTDRIQRWQKKRIALAGAVVGLAGLLALWMIDSKEVIHVVGGML